MGYESAIEAAGATVHASQTFGSYQGDGWALVTFNGATGWVTYAFGSCSHCDAYEGHFGWDDPSAEDLAAFGRGYLDEILTADEAIRRAGQYSAWDCEADAMVDFIRKESAAAGLSVSA